MPNYKVSKDGKTVTVGGKTLSISAFKNQYDFRTPIAKPGEIGGAVTRQKATVVSPKVSNSPEQAKSRAEKKAQKAGVKALNKAGLGKKLTEPKPATGKTRMGGLGTGRGARGGSAGGMGFPGSANQ